MSARLSLLVLIVAAAVACNDAEYRREQELQRAARAANAADNLPPLPKCCLVCNVGKPCGDQCVAQANSCNMPRGCACAGPPAPQPTVVNLVRDSQGNLIVAGGPAPARLTPPPPPNATYSQTNSDQIYFVCLQEANCISEGDLIKIMNDCIARMSAELDAGIGRDQFESAQKWCSRNQVGCAWAKCASSGH